MAGTVQYPIPQVKHPNSLGITYTHTCTNTSVIIQMISKHLLVCTNTFAHTGTYAIVYKCSCRLTDYHWLYSHIKSCYILKCFNTFYLNLFPGKCMFTLRDTRVAGWHFTHTIKSCHVMAMFCLLIEKNRKPGWPCSRAVLRVVLCCEE